MSPLSLNRYAYAMNNPVMNIDPSGHMALAESDGGSSYGMVRNGSSGSNVTQLQTMLSSAGFNPGTIDGIFGNKTEQAVRAYKASKHLLVDGIVGDQTWGALLGAGTSSSLSSDSSTLPTEILRKGSTGSAVKKLLEDLIGLGYLDKNGADGIFGNKTEQAVLLFQETKGLSVDGIVGSQTWSALQSQRNGCDGKDYINGQGTDNIDNNINLPSVLYNYTSDAQKYSISSQNILLKLTQRWFDAQTIDERNKVEVALIMFRANVKEGGVQQYFDKTLNDILGGIIGQIILYPTGVSELELNSRRDALLDSETNYMYAVLSVKHLNGNSKIDYKRVFFEANPELEGEVIVHHGVEQQVLRRPETSGLFTEDEIHAYENLRGIPKEINADLHLSRIRMEWNRFYKENPNPTKDEILNKRLEIHVKFGGEFKPPIE